MGLRMNKYYSFLFIWIISWSLVLYDQLTISIQIFTEERVYASSVAPPGYTVIQSGGNKTLVSDEVAYQHEINKGDHECNDPEFWANIKYEYNYETNTFYIDFNGYKPSDYSVNKLNLLVKPKLGRYGIGHMGGFDFYNYRKINLAIEEEKDTVITINLDLFNGSYKHNRNYENGVDIQLELEALKNIDWKNTEKEEPCNKKTVFTLRKDKLTNYEYLNPYFKDGIFEPYNMDYYDVRKIGEEAYIENFMEFQELRKINNNLPPVDEATVALLGKDLDLGVSDWDWIESNISRINIRNRKTVIGLYGEVRESDLKLVSNLLDVLHVVAPKLDISYSDKSSEVTLPIHIVTCTKPMGDEDGYDCYEKYLGVYYGSDDVIWVEGTLRGASRNHVITHEIGHALGLRHNLCFDSTMSYRFEADDVPYFSYVDLMQLSALYNPLVKEWSDKNVGKAEKIHTTRSRLIETFNLSEEKVEEYEENIETACYVSPGAYDFLIKMQGGKT